MIFQKKQKVPQYLGNSFKNFNEDYENLTKNLSTKFKHTNMRNIEETSLIKINTNPKCVGNTWDSKHLESFVAKSPWATQSIYFENNASASTNLQQNPTQAYSNNQNNNNGNNNNYDQKSRRGEKRVSQSSKLNNRANSSMKNNSIQNKNELKDINTNVRESYFFNSVSRFVDDNNFRKIDYPDRYSEKNFLVCDRNDNDPNYYDKHFSVNRHTDNSSIKLSMCFQPVSLMTPAQKLDQLLQVKGEQKDFQSWKSEYAKMNKKYRVHKGMYPSGILQIDNPNNFQSQLYSEEAKKEYFNKMRQERFKQLHRDRIAHHERTNPQVEFLNSYSQKIFPNKDYNDSVKKPELNNSSFRFQHQYDQLNGGQMNSSQLFNPSQRERLSPNWMSKRPVATNFICQGKDTGDRLFGAEAKNYSLSRAQYLRDQDTKSRNFNIIAFTDNKIEFKQDKGLKNQEI